MKKFRAICQSTHVYTSLIYRSVACDHFRWRVDKYRIVVFWKHWIFRAGFYSEATRKFLQSIPISSYYAFVTDKVEYSILHT